MKRFILLLSVLSLTVACDELYGPEETPLTPDTAAGVQISISDVTDNSFKVTVTPSGEASYYSYLVDESDAAAQLDATTLYEVGYESLAQGTVEYASNPSYSFTVSAEPNTTYQVYAVAGSAMGFAGEIAVASVKTSDGVNPSVTASAYQGSVVQLTFSEAVTVGNGTATARYFARQKTAINEDIEEGTYTIPAENIVCNGNTVTITVDVPAGAYYALNYPAGMFVDSANNPVAELKSGFSAASGSLAPYGAYGRAEFTTWAFDESEVEIVSDAEYMFTFTTSEAQIAKYGEGAATVTYTKGGRTVTNNLTAKSDYVIAPGADGNACVYLMLPEAPDYGATVTFNFEEDLFWDIYGNSSAAYEAECLFSFGYELSDLVGNYEGAYYCAFDGKWYGMALTVEASDNEAKGNVMITDGFSTDFTFTKPVYATFDMNGGTLTIPSGQLFGTFTAGDVTYGVAVFASDNTASPITDSAVFNVSEAGTITGGGLFGFMLVDLATMSIVDWYDVSGGFDLERVESAATAVLSSAPVAKHIPVGTRLQ